LLVLWFVKYEEWTIGFLVSLDINIDSFGFLTNLFSIQFVRSLLSLVCLSFSVLTYMPIVHRRYFLCFQNIFEVEYKNLSA